MNNKFSKKRYIKLKEIQFDKNKRKNGLISKITKTKRKKFIKCYITFIIIIINIILILIYITTKNQSPFNLLNILSIFYKKRPPFNYKEHIYSRGQTLDRGLKYIKECREGNLLISSSKFKKVNSPKISVVIPIYNCERTLKSAIRSVQNQDMLDIEIILINDNSNQKTISLVNELMNQDPRIRLINNERRKGQFYSRNIGALEAKGEYIVNLDSDDMYIDTDVFNIVSLIDIILENTCLIIEKIKLYFNLDLVVMRYQLMDNGK